MVIFHFLKIRTSIDFSASMKLPVSKHRYFGKHIIKREGFFYVHVYGQRQTGRNYGAYYAPSICVFAVFESLKASFA